VQKIAVVERIQEARTAVSSIVPVKTVTLG